LRSSYFIPVLALVFASGCAGQTAVTAAAPAPAEPKAPTEQYQIGAGDVLKISVWKNPELETTAPVRPDGNISVPLVGDVRAVGLQPAELQAALNQAFERYVTAPATTVIVAEIHSRKVFVTGEVAKPGDYELQPRMRLVQALAMAGGLTPYAKDKVVVLRQHGGSEQRIEVRLSRIVSGSDLDANLLLLPGDTVVVP
jgi:polysaccharide export outer membrane protein